MIICTRCGLEDANYYFDGEEYYCEDCFDEMEEEDGELEEE